MGFNIHWKGQFWIGELRFARSDCPFFCRKFLIFQKFCLLSENSPDVGILRYTKFLDTAVGKHGAAFVF
jgi:hypothetical protein